MTEYSPAAAGQPIRSAVAEAGPVAILDFGPGAGGRRTFGAPLEVLSANKHGDVPMVLQQAEAAALAGRFVVGYVAYEAAPAFDPAMSTHAPAEAPLAWFAVFDPAEVGAAAGLDAADAPPASVAAPTPWTSDTDARSYEAAIRAIRGDIERGRFYQINYTARLHGRAPDPEILFRRLTAAQRAGFGALLHTGRWTVVSASPELFFRRVGRDVETRPMKGTMRRGRWLEEDAAAAARLDASAKDRAENVMIVDLLRNDLGRVAETGTVQVPELFAVERYPTVLQMTSTVTARVKKGTTLADLFAALFPCGSVTGAPKIEAMRGIAELERSPRGVYCGAIGVIEPGGDCAFSVAIRTVVVDRKTGVAEYGTGGGITWDSTAEAEYAELWSKAAVLDADPAPFALVETMRLDSGVPVRAERHLERLTASATYFGWPAAAVRAEAARVLGAATRRWPRGVWRLRLSAWEGGWIDVAATPLEPGELGFATREEAVASGEEPRTVRLAQDAVQSRDPFLFHKTSRRAVYEGARASAPGAWDVLLHNEAGEATELTRGNLVVELGDTLVTPPRVAGLLAGVFRQELLDGGAIEERPLPVPVVRQARRLWFVNSLRGWVPISLG